MCTLSFRRRSGFTQQELGGMVGVNASSVAQWESGKKYPAFETIRRLLEMGATVEEIFGVDCSKSCPKALDEHKPSYDASDSTPITRSEVKKMINEAMQGTLPNPAKAG